MGVVVSATTLTSFTRGGYKQDMKNLALSLVLASGLAFLGGCGTPGYTPLERNQMIARNWDYEAKQATDDFDALLLLRPASRLTIWNVR
jgi:hypothetical protein